MTNYQRLETEKYWYELQLEREAEEDTAKRQKTFEKIAFVVALIASTAAFMWAIRYFG